MPNIGLANIAKIRLAEQGGDPAAPAAGYWYAYIKSDGLYLEDESSNVYGPFTTDHGSLDGLLDDDHTQYFNSVRGDARYPQLAHGHSGTVDGSKLAQANTHESADTDAAAGSLHHTIGVGATNAAAGNHTHAGGAGHTIQDEGSDMTARTNLNFVGAGVTVTDDAGNDATVVTIPTATLGSGQTLLTIHPYQNEPPAANYATLDTRNGHPVLDFDAATDESAIFTGIMPRSYAGGGVTVYLHLTDTNDTNAAHKSYWDVSFERDTAQDLDADSFAAAQSGNISPNGTSGIPVVLAIAFTNGAQMDSVAAGELFRLMVTRDANNGSDDWANDAELIFCEIKET